MCLSLGSKFSLINGAHRYGLILAKAGQSTRMAVAIVPGGDFSFRREYSMALQER